MRESPPWKGNTHSPTEREREREFILIKLFRVLKPFPSFLSPSLPLSSSSSSSSFFSTLPVFPRVPNILIAAHRPFDGSPNHCEEISYCPFPLCVCVCVCVWQCVCVWDGVLPNDGYTIGRCMVDPLWVWVCVCADLRSKSLNREAIREN